MHFFHNINHPKYFGYPQYKLRRRVCELNNTFISTPLGMTANCHPECGRRINPLKTLILSFLLVFLFTIPSPAQFIEYNHPELEWKSFDTEHFVIHFPVGAKRTAQVIAKIAEDIYPHVTGVYDYIPAGKMHFVIKDTDDYSNGGAYFLDNKIEIWASNLDYIMRGTTDWLRNVITHEYTHMISIQKMMKSNRTIPFGFLQFFSYEKEKRKDVVRGFPNTVMVYPVSSIILPIWFAEGTAQHQVNQSRYDYRDPHREMILRDRILYNQLLSYNAMSVFGKDSHGNESSYNLGFSFIDYLSRRFGEDILRKITNQASRWNEFTFESAFKTATTYSVDTLYTAWKDSLEHIYSGRTETIHQNQQRGAAIEKQGSANLYPIWSPDGKRIAYVSNKGQDYFSKNGLVLFDTKTGHKKELVKGVKSSLSWSPNGRYLLYARQEMNDYHSSHNDLFVYDLQQEQEIRLTKNMRATNPDFSHDGKRITFVSATNGLTQLNILTLEDSLQENLSGTAWYNRETGVINTEKKTDKTLWRTVEFSGQQLRQLLAFDNGRQIFHPRWSNGDSLIVFDTAVEYGRNLGVYRMNSEKFELFQTAEEELRYPFFQPGSSWMYYAASSTGIYNIYRRHLQTGKTELLTNVTGGAMMPAVNLQGDLVYSLYDSIGYHIYQMEQPQSIDPELAVYNPDYITNIPDKNFDNSITEEPEIRKYKQELTGIHILPRLWIDYGTVKPGFFVTSADVLNKYNLTAGVAVNSDFDYDLYGYFEVKEFEPTLFIEAYNISANINDDTLHISRSDQHDRPPLIFHRDIKFNLTEVHLGLSGRIFDFLDYKAKYIFRKYDAKIYTHYLYDPYENQKYDAYPFHYSYLKGHALEWSLTANQPRLDKNREINPTGGYYFHLVHSLEYNDFLKGFAVNASQTGLAEQFDNYTFNRVELDAEKYYKNPLFPSHGLGLRWRAGFIDRKVDDFFDLYVGGLIGMKGYSYFSMQGRYKSILTFSYRFPLWQNMDLRFGNLYLDKMYFGLFYDWGNAWYDNKTLKFNDFKRDIGLQLRMDSFSYSLFPTRFFAEAVYPLDTAQNFDESRKYIVKYPREWRYYFGLLYEFDLREKVAGFLPKIR